MNEPTNRDRLFRDYQSERRRARLRRMQRRRIAETLINIVYAFEFVLNSAILLAILFVVIVGWIMSLVAALLR